MKLPKEQKDIDAYVKRAEQAIASINHEWETAYSVMEKKYLLKNDRTIDYKVLESSNGRVEVADFIVDYLSSKLEDYLGFKLENDEERSIAFRDILGASKLEIKLYFARNSKALSQGHIRDAWVKNKQDALQKILSRTLVGAGIRFDKNTRKAYSITDRKKREESGEYERFDDYSDYFEDDMIRSRNRQMASASSLG